MSQTWWNSASQRGTYARTHLSGQNQVMGRSAYTYSTVNLLTAAAEEAPGDAYQFSGAPLPRVTVVEGPGGYTFR